jgi:hypothetical protein
VTDILLDQRLRPCATNVLRDLSGGEDLPRISVLEVLPVCRAAEPGVGIALGETGPSAGVRLGTPAVPRHRTGNLAGETVVEPV